ncbi:hemerythrin domain-containing protein [Pseudonocardia sp. C8]|uniref:hemerythrin domain-containing protein n=1 Tax=Pseudonocardia sp. C8 TaxID=2762759 RepID=UPI0016432AA9|nr:hemerythrin domain-containing protein [Pseudonocardia sp. C8]
MTSHSGTGDLVDVLVGDHRTLLDLLDHAAAADHGPQRSDLALRAVNAVRRHCVTEERLLHPLLRRCLDDGDRCTDADTEEHEQLERLAAELTDVGPGSPAAADLLRELAASARRHVEGVEGRRLPVLRKCLTVTELHDLADTARSELGIGTDDRSGPAPVTG